MSVEKLITDNLDIWTSAIKTKSASGRGSSNKLELYGIKKLRELILELAVRGKLVHQDPNDEPASKLLERIAAEKEQLIKDKKIKKQKPLSTISVGEYPYDIPESWKWCFLGELGTVVGGGTPKSSEPAYWTENGIKWLTPADLYGKKEKYISSGKRDISSLGLEKSSAQLLPAGSVLFSSRAPIGYVAITSSELSTNQGFKSVVPYTEGLSDYLYYFLKSAAKKIDANASGTTFKEVSGAVVNKIATPIPPLEEQKRIVAKVDELMALCDQLETQTEANIEAHQTLVKTLLGTLTNAKDAYELSESWQRISEYFDVLFTTEDSIDQLKQTILQLAVMGKLVKQDPSDEPVLSLFDRIEVARNERICKKEIQKPKKVTVSDELEADFPDAWKTSLLNDLVFVTKLAGFEYTKYFDLKDKGEIPVIRAQNVRPFKPSKENLKYLDKQTSEMLPRSALDRPSLLVTFIGAGIGDVCIFNETTRWHLAPNVAKVEPFADVNLDFLCIYLNSPLGRNQLFKSMKSTAQPSLSMTTIREIWVPILRDPHEFNSMCFRPMHCLLWSCTI